MSNFNELIAMQESSSVRGRRPGVRGRSLAARGQAARLDDHDGARHPHASRSCRRRRGDGEGDRRHRLRRRRRGRVAASRGAVGARSSGSPAARRIAVGDARDRVAADAGPHRRRHSYIVDGNVFTGDTLFVGGCGRTDFPGGDAPTLWRACSGWRRCPRRRASIPGTTTDRRRPRRSAGRRRPIRTCCARARRSSSRCARARTRRGRRRR